MLKKIRNDLGLTQSEVAEATGTSVNYVLKAEGLTFPTPPAQILDYYASLVEEGTEDRRQYVEYLKEQYIDTQREQRKEWFNYYVPVDAAHIGKTPKFNEWWRPVVDEYRKLGKLELVEFQFTFPTQYAISKLLCVPASSTYRACTKKPNQSYPEVFKEVINQLITYIDSGRYHNKHSDVESINLMYVRMRKIRGILHDEK